MAQESDNPCLHLNSSCNEDQSLCCEWWFVDVTTGSYTGGILEDSYEKLQASIARNKRVAESLCRWGFRSDCETSYGSPRCSGTSAETRARVEGVDLGAGRLQDAVHDATAEVGRVHGKKSALEAFMHVQTFEDAADVGNSQLAAGEGARMLREQVRRGHETLDEYATVLERGEARALAFGKEANRCFRGLNPFLELERESKRGWLSLGFGFPIPTNDLPVLPFVPPSLQGSQDSAASDARKATRGIPLGAIGTENLTVEKPSMIRGIRRQGSGRLLLGQAGSMTDGQVVEAGQFPIAFVASQGAGVSFGKVQISRQEDGPTEIVAITGWGSTGAEWLELVSCGSGTTLMRDGACRCPNNMSWNGRACGCPSSMISTGSRCVCASGSHQQGSTCVRCINGAQWNGRSCVCPRSSMARPEGCVCPDGTVWDSSGTECVTPSRAPAQRGRFQAIPVCDPGPCP